MVIDDKGRLWGKVNIIDLFLFCLFFLCGIALVVGYTIISNKKTEKKEYTDTEINCRIVRLQKDSLELLKVGDKETNKQGVVIGQIVSVGEPNPYSYKINLGNDDVRVIKDSSLLEVPAVIRLHAELSGDGLYYNGGRVLIDQPFNFKTEKYVVTVVPAATKSDDFQWVKVKVKFIGVMSELSSIINAGHIEKDADGKIIGKLTEIISNTQSQVSYFSLMDNKVSFVSDPYRNDIIINMELSCAKKEDTLYFKNFPVKIGAQITFIANVYIITGTIIQVESP